VSISYQTWHQGRACCPHDGPSRTWRDGTDAARATTHESQTRVAQ